MSNGRETGAVSLYEVYPSPEMGEIRGFDTVSHQLTFLSPLLRKVNLSQQGFLQKSHRFDGGFLLHNAWRKRLASERFGTAVTEYGELPATGCERYFLGTGCDLATILRSEATIGRRMLEGVDRFSRAHPYYRGDVELTRRSILTTAKGEVLDSRALPILNALYGAEMARLRALRLQSPHASRLIQESDDLVSSLGSVEYTMENGIAVEDYYKLPRVTDQYYPTQMVELSRSDVSAIRFLSDVGRVGHPLVRQMLSAEMS